MIEHSFRKRGKSPLEIRKASKTPQRQEKGNNRKNKSTNKPKLDQGKNPKQPKFKLNSSFRTLETNDLDSMKRQLNVNIDSDERSNRNSSRKRIHSKNISKSNNRNPNLDNGSNKLIVDNDYNYAASPLKPKVNIQLGKPPKKRFELNSLMADPHANSYQRIIKDKIKNNELKQKKNPSGDVLRKAEELWNDSNNIRKPMYPDKTKKQRKRSVRKGPEIHDQDEIDQKAQAIQNYLDHGKKNSDTFLVANMLENDIQENDPDYHKLIASSDDLVSESIEQNHIVKLKHGSKNSILSQNQKVDSLINISNAFNSNQDNGAKNVDLSVLSANSNKENDSKKNNSIKKNQSDKYVLFKKKSSKNLNAFKDPNDDLKKNADIFALKNEVDLKRLDPEVKPDIEPYNSDTLSSKMRKFHELRKSSSNQNQDNVLSNKEIEKPNFTNDSHSSDNPKTNNGFNDEQGDQRFKDDLKKFLDETKQDVKNSISNKSEEGDLFKSGGNNLPEQNKNNAMENYEKKILDEIKKSKPKSIMQPNTSDSITKKARPYKRIQPGDTFKRFAGEKERIIEEENCDAYANYDNNYTMETDNSNLRHKSCLQHSSPLKRRDKIVVSKVYNRTSHTKSRNKNEKCNNLDEFFDQLQKISDHMPAPTLLTKNSISNRSKNQVTKKKFDRTIDPEKNPINLQQEKPGKEDFQQELGIIKNKNGSYKVIPENENSCKEIQPKQNFPKQTTQQILIKSGDVYYNEAIGKKSKAIIDKEGVLKMMIPVNEENFEKNIDECPWDVLWKCEKPTTLINKEDYLNSEKKHSKPPIIKMNRVIDRHDMEDVHSITLMKDGSLVFKNQNLNFLKVFEEPLENIEEAPSLSNIVADDDSKLEEETGSKKSLSYYKSKYQVDPISSKNLSEIIHFINLFKKLGVNTANHFTRTQIADELDFTEQIEKIEDIFDRRSGFQKQIRNKDKSQSRSLKRYPIELTAFPKYLIYNIKERIGMENQAKELIEIIIGINFYKDSFVINFFKGLIMNNYTYQDMAFYLMMREFVKFFLQKKNCGYYYNSENFYKTSQQPLKKADCLSIVYAAFHMIEKKCKAIPIYICRLESLYEDVVTVQISQFLEDCLNIFHELKSESGLAGLVRDLEEGLMNKLRRENKLYNEKMHILDDLQMQKSYPQLYKNNPSEEQEIEVFFKNFESKKHGKHRELPHLDIGSEKKWKNLQKKLSKTTFEDKNSMYQHSKQSNFSPSHSNKEKSRSISQISVSKSGKINALLRKNNNEKLDYLNFVKNYSYIKSNEESMLDDKSLAFSKSKDQKNFSRNQDLSYSFKSRDNSILARTKKKGLNKSFSTTKEVKIDKYKLEDLTKIAVNDMEIKALIKVSRVIEDNCIKKLDGQERKKIIQECLKNTKALCTSLINKNFTGWKKLLSNSINKSKNIDKDEFLILHNRMNSLVQNPYDEKNVKAVERINMLILADLNYENMLLECIKKNTGS